MKTSVYVNLQRKIIVITLLVSFAPLILLGVTIYHQLAIKYKQKIVEQIRYRAVAQAEAVDLFLKGRTAILSAMADTHKFDYMIEGNNLAHIFEVMNSRAGAFVDLGVIDSTGQHKAYVGPYKLKGLNYYNQPWFGEVMSKGVYISEVYMEIFEGIVRAAQVGQTGDAFIVNKERIFQTNPRFSGSIHCQSKLDTTLFGGSTTVIELRDGDGKKRLYAGTWLKNKKWLLVINQEAAEEMAGLFTTYMEIAIIVAGILAIVLTTIFTTRLTVRRLREADTKMRELNAQLVQSDKMAALGKMAAGVAHEINNPLAVILQKTGWMEDLLAEEEFQESENIEEFKASIKKIEAHVERARKVVHNMLGYVRKMEPLLEDVDINETLSQTINLLENYAKTNNIEIAPDFTDGLPIIASKQDQLQQVFLNLISNAIDAINTDGLIKVISERNDKYIIVKIIDNGPGIPEDQHRKVFDPFFTTKETGRGTGLGLWISYDITEKLGGTIHLSSREGEGTIFTIQIPIVHPERK
ncbi:MAG: two-component sensor histidine kinase [Deltaproteobacteria bacterium]|nr:two-component sensor histidine kinase [Deltaproteobacteria bacterium]